MYNTAIILGAGNSARMGGEKSKMLLKIGGKTVIERSVEAFSDMPEIDEIIVVCRECDLKAFSELLPDESVSFVIGGSTRQQSVFNAVETIDGCDYLIIHDGARPLVSPQTILKTLDKAQETGAAATGVPVKDTIKVIDGEFNIIDTPDRDALIAIQTPQIFDFKLYTRAIELAKESGEDYTDDCRLVEKLDAKVSAVIGDYDNIKITTQSDIALAENILRKRGEL